MKTGSNTDFVTISEELKGILGVDKYWTLKYDDFEKDGGYNVQFDKYDSVLIAQLLFKAFMVFFLYL